MQQLLLLFSTKLVYWATRLPLHSIARIIAWFVKKYDVNMSEAKEQDLAQYEHFNAFFTRELDMSKRPMSDAEVVSPVDGKIATHGQIDDDTLLQAKGHTYSLTALLGSLDWSEPYEQGSYLNIYLSPRDYHRIHMPMDGKLLRCRRIPGTLFSVSPKTAQSVKGLFARNERVVAEFEGSQGKFSMVLVGAVNVRAIDTVWQQKLTPAQNRKIEDYDTPDIRLAKGEEMGRFNMGSTVILVFEKGYQFAGEFGDEVKVRANVLA
ncbi:MAG: phosphatidylserine decarboxylase [Gammaproteobacteria bacterium]|nr:phosphatidylserine decarboxylase [Gammaproteobacteria bacterium]